MAVQAVQVRQVQIMQMCLDGAHSTSLLHIQDMLSSVDFFSTVLQLVSKYPYFSSSSGPAPSFFSKFLILPSLEVLSLLSLHQNPFCFCSYPHKLWIPAQILSLAWPCPFIIFPHTPCCQCYGYPISFLQHRAIFLQVVGICSLKVSSFSMYLLLRSLIQRQYQFGPIQDPPLFMDLSCVCVHSRLVHEKFLFQIKGAVVQPIPSSCGFS